MPLNPHLWDALNQAGLIRTARISTCPRCGVSTVVGLDADTAAIEVRTNLKALDPAGEYFALSRGLATFDLVTRNRRAYLYRRDEWNITGHPAQSGRWTVVAEHRCLKPSQED